MHCNQKTCSLLLSIANSTLKKHLDQSFSLCYHLCIHSIQFFVLTLIFSFLNISPGGGEGNADTVLIHFLMEAARISNSDIPRKNFRISSISICNHLILYTC